MWRNDQKTETARNLAFRAVLFCGSGCFPAVKDRRELFVDQEGDGAYRQLLDEGKGDIEAQKRVEQAQERGIRKTVRAIVVGVPNVGKSMLINRLHGSSVREVSDRPGVTRNNEWVKVSQYLEILDTPGLLWPRLDDQQAALRLSYISAIRDEVQNIYDLAIRLLEDVTAIKPEAVVSRFRVSDPELRGQELLESVCFGRGFLLKGGQPDTERGARVVLDEFRGGKLGRITLEKAPEVERQA